METIKDWLEKELQTAEENIDETACDYVRGSRNGTIHGLRMALLQASHIEVMENLERQRLKAFHNCK